MGMKFRPEPDFSAVMDPLCGLALVQCEPGYWLGELEILGLYNHVEVIEVKRDTELNVHALNQRFQGRVDSWYERNEGSTPKLVVLGKRRFFINTDVAAE